MSNLDCEVSSLPARINSYLNSAYRTLGDSASSPLLEITMLSTLVTANTNETFFLMWYNSDKFLFIRIVNSSNKFLLTRIINSSTFYNGIFIANIYLNIINCKILLGYPRDSRNKNIEFILLYRYIFCILCIFLIILPCFTYLAYSAQWHLFQVVVVYSREFPKKQKSDNCNNYQQYSWSAKQAFLSDITCASSRDWTLAVSIGCLLACKLSYRSLREPAFHHSLPPQLRAQLFTYHHLQLSLPSFVLSHEAPGKCAASLCISSGIVPVLPTGNHM